MIEAPPKYGRRGFGMLAVALAASSAVAVGTEPPDLSRATPAQLVTAICAAADRNQLRAELQTRGASVARDLVAILRDVNRGHCWERAAGALYTIGPGAGAEIPSLLEMLRPARLAGSSSAQVEVFRRGYVISALNGIGVGNARVEDALIDLVMSGDPSSQGMAAMALGNMGANRATGALAQALGSGPGMAAEMAASALRQIGPPAAAAVPALIAVARANPKAYLSKVCINALTAIGTAEAKDGIRQLMAQR